MSGVSRSVEQAAENGAMFRVANEKFERQAGRLVDADVSIPYLCECEDERCKELVLLNRKQYEAVRAHAKRFLMVSGHQGPDDRLISEERGVTVIEKTGKEGELVAARDPRS